MKKTFLYILFLFGAMTLFVQPVWAKALDYPKPNEIMNQIMSFLGMDKKEAQNMGKSMSVARMKQNAPQASLEFSPANPVNGEKITAIAQTTYFMNDPNDLFYTWYLKHKDCDRSSDLNDKNKKCDSDGDGDVDENDWKVEATRIIVNGSFSWDKESYEKNSDKDGYDVREVFGGEDQRGKNSHCYVHDVDSGNDSELKECKHLFPRVLGKSAEDTGDGSFGIEEERFWHTDPNNSDTAGLGNVDEANVVGLGVVSFSWVYLSGDEVGLAVEGVSTTPTTYEDSSYKTMWAFSKNKCETEGSGGDDGSVLTERETVSGPDSDGYITVVKTTRQTRTTYFTAEGRKLVEYKDIRKETTKYTDITRETVAPGGDTIIESFESLSTFEDGSPEAPDPNMKLVDSGVTGEVVGKYSNIYSSEDESLNKCLKSNLVSPAEGGQNEKMEVELSYLPENPMNDESGKNSADVTIVSSVMNAKNENALKYVWEVYTTKENNPYPEKGWGSALLKKDISEISQTVGTGISSLNFKMAFDEKIKYVKVKLSVTENASGEESKEGHAEVLIPVASVSDRIHVFPVKVSDDLKLSMENKERCKDGIDAALCPVVRNEIIGMKIENNNLKNFQWMIDGEPLNNGDSECSSGECDKKTGENTRIAYLPVLNEKGERYTVSVTAEDKDEKTVNISKVFEVIDPNVKIEPVDQKICQPELLGSYVDLNGKEWPDYSESDFQSPSGSLVSLKPVFNNSSIANYAWFIDSTEINSGTAGAFGASIADDGTLTFAANKKIGENYDVAIEALYTQDNNTKKFLNKNYNVQLNEFYEDMIDSAINIKITESVENVQTGNVKSGRKILAGLITGLPEYINFLFRIALTIMLILAGSWIIMMLTQYPNAYQSEDDKKT
jgi:hypothetical protein